MPQKEFCNTIGGIADMAGLAAGSIRLRMIAEVSRQRAMPRGDAEVGFQRRILNQGLFFRSLDIGFGFAKPRD
ncbi:MAG TPA: hypothetical protein VN831_23065 [Bradyrhizobium sp.]|nr:hypothetical protein [Bradyrhizobium sp.]